MIVIRQSIGVRVKPTEMQAGEEMKAAWRGNKKSLPA